VQLSYPVRGKSRRIRPQLCCKQWSTFTVPATTGRKLQWLLYRKGVAELHYSILQTEAHLAISSCTYSTFLIRVADADADPNRFPQVELRQTLDAYAHNITGLP
jgi:hypothetical protein